MLSGFSYLFSLLEVRFLLLKSQIKTHSLDQHMARAVVLKFLPGAGQSRPHSISVVSGCTGDLVIAKWPWVAGQDERVSGMQTAEEESGGISCASLLLSLIFCMCVCTHGCYMYIRAYAHACVCMYIRKPDVNTSHHSLLFHNFYLGEEVMGREQSH